MQVSTMDRNSSVFYVIYLMLLCCTWSKTHAELYTAISEVEPLLHTHEKLINDLDDYIQKEEKRIFVLKRHLNTYKREHDHAIEDIPNYLGNPLNAFTLIKRLTTDLSEIEKSIKIGSEYIKNVTTDHKDTKYPTAEDLVGAAQALSRLQQTYQLDVKDLSKGVLNGVRYSTPMSAGDCFELGRALYNDKDYENALAWMTQALQKFQEERDDTYSFTEVDILAYINYTYYLLGDVRSALEWAERLLELDPSNNQAQINISYYQKDIAEEKKQLEETGFVKPSDKKNPDELLTTDDRNTYEALCRGEMEAPGVIAKKLKCRYITENHPFLKLAPIKVEQVYIEPDVYVFHEVMSDDEIKFVQDLAKPRFNRASVIDSKTGKLIPAPYRTSKSAWLRDEESKVIARISQRVSDFTGLSMESAEELQVVNYGIGGHYSPHYDFSLKSNFVTELNKRDGKRIATVLFYMSDVAQGGATVFTELGISVFPIKNAALFWYNLHPSGEGDMSTRHAACPVLRGSKWVSNKWIHQRGQELTKPCNLEHQEEDVMRKIIPAKPKTVFR